MPKGYRKAARSTVKNSKTSHHVLPAFQDMDGSSSLTHVTVPTVKCCPSAYLLTKNVPCQTVCFGFLPESSGKANYYVKWPKSAKKSQFINLDSIKCEAFLYHKIRL